VLGNENKGNSRYLTAKVVHYPQCCVLCQSVPKDVLFGFSGEAAGGFFFLLKGCAFFYLLIHKIRLYLGFIGLSGLKTFTKNGCVISGKSIQISALKRSKGFAD